MAHALGHGHTVVSHEVAEGTKKKVKIPDVCAGLGIKYLPIFELLRLEKALFVLG